MSKKLICLISFVLLATSIVSAEPLRVDLSQNGDVEPGWVDWNTGGNRLGNSDVSRQFLNETDFDDDFTIDFINIDSRNRGQVNDSIDLHDLLDDGFKESSAFDMVIKGLAGGKYVISTYHHDTNEDVVNDDGTVNITVTDADGTRLVIDHLQQSWGPNPTLVAIATFMFRSDGSSDVVITFEDNNDGIHNEAHLNGFEIDLPVLPGSAFNPNPVHEATDVPRDVVLSWTPGIYAPAINGHKVYLSENFNDVNDATGGITQDANSYTPAQRLDFNTTYYWRVDEVNGAPDFTVHPGEVWSFTTEPFAYPIAGENITATASSTSEGMGPENTINGSGLGANDLHSTETADMWLSSDEPNGAWIEYELDKVYKLHQMWVWNSNQALESMFGLGCKEVSIKYSVNGTDYTALAGVPEFAQASGTPDYAHNTTVDLSGVTAKYVRFTANSNWGGFFKQYGLSEVRFFSIPVQAREPSPDSGATDVDVDVTLGFRAGREAAEHNVYISTDEQAVIDSNVPVSIVTEAHHGPISLDLGETYYWKVNEVNMAETPTTWQGKIWNFTTPEYFVVDDFEDYNDYPPNEIWFTWVDGYGVPANGATAGYPEPIDFLAGEHYIETTTVHGGEQAMPFFYDNTGTAAYSEATRTFAVPQDWTKAGVQALVLYFQGSPGNTGQLYVNVNGSKEVYPGDAVDITRPRWKQWGIDLASLGVDLQNVTTLAIGIDDSGASGTLYLDDIGLYPSVPEQTALEIWIEAEAADSITEPMKIYPAAGVDPVADAGGKGEPSGGLYIGTTSDVPGNNDSPGTQDIATYTFTVPTAGTYAIWGRVSNVADDSLWVHIPDGQYDVPVHSSGWIRWNSIEPETADWHWVRVFSDDASDNAVVNVTLTAGQHTILWAHRESENFLDAIVISKID